MNKQTKILASAFAGIILFGVLTKVVYPNWIRPWVALDEQITTKQEELAKLTDLKDQVGKARDEYRGWVERTGSFEVQQVMTDVRDRLNQLIAKHGLEEAKVTPNRANVERKTGRTTTGVTVTATGNLASSINFLKDVSELPHLIRVMNPSFAPAASGRRDMPEDRLNIKVPIELWVLPQNKVVGHIDPAKLVRPEFYVRHQGRDYSSIWTGQPFTDYVELQAQTNPSNVQVQIGQGAALNVTASGGHGNYKYEWSPPEGLTDPASPSPKVDTTEVGNKRYTVTVTDATGHKAQGMVMVNVSKPPEQQPVQEVVQVPVQPKGPTKPPGPQPWPDAGSWEIRMALLQSKGGEREDELMLFNTATQTKKYVTLGEDLNGGKLLFVHQRGSLGQRGGEYFIYPLGLAVSNEIPADDAQDYPELQRAMTFHRNALAELSRKKTEDDAAAKAPGLQVPAEKENQDPPDPNLPGDAEESPDADPNLAAPAQPESPDTGLGEPEAAIPAAGENQEAIAPAGTEDTQGPPAGSANSETQGPPTDAADVTAAPGRTTGTSGDGPPADAAGAETNKVPPADAPEAEKKAEEGGTGTPPKPATKRRPTRTRRPK